MAEKPQPEKKTRSNGFILIATLSLLTLLVLTLLAMTAFMRVESDLNKSQRNLSIARRNALTGLDIALGQLQLHSGSDRTTTLPAGILLDENPATPEPDNVLHPYWTYTAGTTTAWLVSSSSTPEPNTRIPDNLKVRIVDSGTLGNANIDQAVVCEKIPLISFPSELPGGYYAYWVGELNTKANVSVYDTLVNTTISTYEKAVNDLSIPRRTGTEYLFPNSPSIDDNELLSAVQTQQQIFQIKQDSALIKKNFHHITTTSKGVLINPLSGGLKINLTDKTYRDSNITDVIANMINPDYYLDNGVNILTASAFKITANQLGRSYNSSDTPTSGKLLSSHSPLLSEFRLSMGLFHTQSDRKHRLRFHMYTEWLNPFPYDLAFRHPKGYIVIVDNLPMIKIENVSSGLGFSVDLNDFDETLSSNTLNESKINSWQRFANLSNPKGNLKYGIDAGRVYRMTEPDLTHQPQGLARTLAESSDDRWYYRDSSAPASGARQKNSIYGDDDIHVFMSKNTLKIDLTLVPIYDNVYRKKPNMPMDYSITPDEFLQAHGYVLKLKNIPFSIIDFNLSGSTYSRSTSGSFSENDYRIAFHFRLKDDPETLTILSEQLAIHNAVIDLDNSMMRQLFEITSDTRQAASQGIGFSELDLFTDSEERVNSPPAPGEYQFSLYDIPITEPISVGVLSQLRFQDRPHPWVGSPQAITWNEVFDQYYFSGNQKSAEWEQIPQKWIPGKPPAGVLGNARIEALLKPDNTLPSILEITGANGAEHSLLKGMFNIHSLSVPAWTMILKNQIRNIPGTLDINDHTRSNMIAHNVFSRTPFAAPRYNNSLSDSAIASTNDPISLRYGQGIRSLDDSAEPDQWMEALAREMVIGIRTHISHSGNAIRSISEFANTGIIQSAIDRVRIDGVGINDGIPVMAPSYLRQSDVLSLIGPLLSTRSDTFVIRSYGEVAHPRTGKIQTRAYCEATVQRFPEYVDSQSNRPTDQPSQLNSINAQLGRKYQIIQFRWLQPHEI